MRPLIALIAVSCSFFALGSTAYGFPYTHTVEVSGEFNDNWNVVDPDYCAANGSGSINLKFKTIGPTKVDLMISKWGGRPRTKGVGLWVLAVPVGGGFAGMKTRKVETTVTTADNTVPGPQAPEVVNPCEPTTTVCGVTRSKGLASVGGYDLKHLYSDYVLGQFPALTRCRLGRVESWNWPTAYVGGDNRFGDAIFKMPSKRTIKRKKTIVLTRTINKLSSGPHSENGVDTITDDVTRTVTITFKKL